MSHVSAPYRFVPLSKLVLLPDWADQVSHDQPFADGLCGELQLQLTCHTPLCVGGRQDKSSDREPGKVYFFRAPDNQLAIPGSSLKGMLRNVLEIASFARFRQVEDQRLGVRDISEADNFYARAIVSSPVQAGWMSFSDGQWQIQPCEFSRLHQEQLIEHFKVPRADWKALKTAAQRYKRISTCPPLRFQREAMPKKAGQWLARPAPNGDYHGHVVVTGQPGRDFEAPKAKKYEFVFHASAAQPLPIQPEVMAGFQQIHDDSDEWKFWREQLATGSLGQGIPVFFHKDGEQVKSLGLAMMYKLPYSHSLHDAIRHTHDEHLSERAADLPDLIFGHLGEGERGGLRGRVNIGLASLAAEHQGRTDWEGPCILNNPKPTFYPAYIRQDGKGNSFRQLMEKNSELAGWKRYPVKAFEMQYPQGKAADNKKTQVKLETVPAGSIFTTTLRFHNLRRVELGALLWALDFGGRQDHRHALGMGKPFGLGQVSLSIAGQRLRANDPADTGTAREAEYLQACRREFVDLMDMIMQSAGFREAWEDTSPIKALFEYAQPTKLSSDLRYLAEPKDFVALRKAGWLRDLQESFHKHTGLHPLQDYATSLHRKQAEQQRQQALTNASPAQRCQLEVQEALDAQQITAKPGTQEHEKLFELLKKSVETVAQEGSAEEKSELHALIKGARDRKFMVSSKKDKEFKALLATLLS